MAVASLHELLQSYSLRKAHIQSELTNLTSQKSLALSSQMDVHSLKSAEESEIRDYFKNLYDEDESLQGIYDSYTDIPEYEYEINKMEAKFEEQLNELANWELAIDQQMTVYSTELTEIQSAESSYRSMLGTNIQDDFSFGLDGA